MFITSNNRSDWQALADSCAKTRPSVGKTVRVNKGKHSGVVGTVIWHGINRFADTRYKTNAQMMLRDLQGREGYRVKIQPDNGSAPFFVNAEYCEV